MLGCENEKSAGAALGSVLKLASKLLSLVILELDASFSELLKWPLLPRLPLDPCAFFFASPKDAPSPTLVDEVPALDTSGTGACFPCL